MKSFTTDQEGETLLTPSFHSSLHLKIYASALKIGLHLVATLFYSKSVNFLI